MHFFQVLNSSKNTGSFFKTAGRSPSSAKLILNILPVRSGATTKILFDLEHMMRQLH